MDTWTGERIIIEDVYPELNGGRYPVKRVEGESFEVWADIFMDGHDLLLAVLEYKREDEVEWQSVPMEHEGNDRWHGMFTLGGMGRYAYRIAAWPDLFGSWASDTRKKRAAGQDIALELKEGQLLIQSLSPKMKSKKAAGPLAGLEGEKLLEAETLDLVRRHAPRRGEVRYPERFITVDRKRAVFGAWYEMFPRSQGLDAKKSGTFDDCIRRLPDIQAMGFDVVYFPPIHPIGLTHRKGKNNALTAKKGEPGSPYAIGSEQGGHKAVHPQLGTMDDFRRFVEAAKARGMDVALDFAVQVSRDHPYIKEHPEWFDWRPDGTLKYAENPPKKYQDIANLDFAKGGMALWEELRAVVEFWIEAGVTIFRVDNPHTKPFAFWEWLIGTVQAARPDIIFLAEAFTRPKVMNHLAKAGFTQSYTYYTWRNTKAELTEYLTELATDWPKEYFRPNFFPTTPDILPEFLQKSGKPGFITRLALAATLSPSYGMVAGYELCEADALPGKEEYLDSEKYEIKPRDWDAPGNIKPFVTALNRIRQENPALQELKNLRFYPSSNPSVLFYGKRTGSDEVFAAVNLDPLNIQESFIELPLTGTYMLDDLLLGHSWRWNGSRQHLRLDPFINPIAIFRTHTQ
jgi:starch synthase (maltosyl-transferring)